MVSIYIVGFVVTTLLSVAWMELSSYGGCRSLEDAAGALAVGIAWPAATLAFLAAWSFLIFQKRRRG